VTRRELYTTLDGSLIEELVRPEDGSENLSLARATVAPGQRTRRHLHHSSDEVYYVLEGSGVVTVGEEEHRVSPGQAVFIPAGTEHFAEAGQEGLVLLCCCSPPYRHEDTTVTEEAS